MGLATGAAPEVPPPRLLALAGVVLAIHLLVLKAAPGPINLDEPSVTRQFITRSIEINRPPADSPLEAAAPRPLLPEPVPARALQSRPRATAHPGDLDGNAAVAPALTREPAQAAEPLAPAADTFAEPATAASSPAPVADAVLAAPPPRDAGPRATAFSIPGSARLLYTVTGEVKKQTWHARSELLWRHDGSSYQARSEVSAFPAGSRTQTSAGRITSEGLAPVRFSDKSKSEFAAHFERDKGRVVFSANTPDAPLLTGAQDRLSVFLQLGAMIAGEPSRYLPATTVTVQTVGPREADNWLFTIEGEESLALVKGEVTALKLMRNPRREYDIKVELWLAPAMGYLPVRMRLTQHNGDFVDQQLRTSDIP